MSPRDEEATPTRKYWAFISYSSKDRKWGKWLINALETYRIPGSLVGRQTGFGPIPKRLLPVFRDRDELRSGPDLEAALDQALRQSRYLIVLCSPRSALPTSWVNREIVKFKAMGRKTDVLALIVDGEPNASERPGMQAAECFPEALRYDVDAAGRITRDRVEPLAADIRREDPAPRTARRKALLKLIARIIDVDFDSLWQRDAQRRRRRLAILSVAAALLASLLLGLTLLGANATRSEISGRLAEQAAAESADAPGRGLLLSVAAYETAPTAAAYGSLLTSVASATHLIGGFHAMAGVSALAVSHDNAQLAVATCRTTPTCTDSVLHLYDLAALREARPPIALTGSQVTGLAFQPQTGRLLMVESRDDFHRVAALDVTASAPEPEPEQIYRDRAAITRVAWSNDGGLYAVAVGDAQFGELKLFPDGGGRRCGTAADGRIAALAFAPNGSQLAAGSEDGGILVLDTASCETQRLHEERLSDLAFDSSGRYLLSIMPDGTLAEWDLGQAEPATRHLSLRTFMLDGFLHALSQDAAYLASLDGRDVVLDDLATRRRILQDLREAEGLVAQTALRLQIERLAPTRLRGHQSAPVLLRFSPDGQLLATADERGGVLLWDVHGRPLVEALDFDSATATQPTNGGGSAEAVRQDGQILASVGEAAEGCSGDFTLGCKRTTKLTLRNVQTGESIQTLEAVRHGMGAIEPSERFAVAFTENGDVRTAGFTADGRRLAEYLWHVDPQLLIERACRSANRELASSDPAIRRYVHGWQSLLVAGACARGDGG